MARGHLTLVPLYPKLREILRQRPTKEELKAIRVTVLEHHDTSTASFKRLHSRLYIFYFFVNAAGQAFDSCNTPTLKSNNNRENRKHTHAH